jgi:hypothetical protein
MRFLLFTNTTCTMRPPGTVAQNATIPVLYLQLTRRKVDIPRAKRCWDCSSRRDRSEELSREGTIGSTGYI